MTKAELRERTYNRLGLKADQRVALDLDDTIDAYLQEGARQMIVASEALVSTHTITTVADQPVYALADDHVRVRSIYAASPVRKLEPVHFGDIDSRRPLWPQITSDTAEEYMTFGATEVFLLPVPATAGKEYTVTYTQDPGRVVMVQNKSEPPLPARFHRFLIYYAAARYLATFGTPKRVRRAVAYMNDYMRGLALLETESNRNAARLHSMGPAL